MTSHDQCRKITLNPIYLLEFFTFTCGYGGKNIIRDFGGIFCSNKLKLTCEGLKRMMENMKEDKM